MTITCHYCSDTVEKLNSEYDILQGEKDKELSMADNIYKMMTYKNVLIQISRSKNVKYIRRGRKFRRSRYIKYKDQDVLLGRPNPAPNRFLNPWRYW